jgi:hypothetical protein
MQSRTTDANLPLDKLQKIVRDIEGAGYQLQSVCGKEKDGVRFNQLTSEVAAQLPNTGPYTQLFRLAPGITDPKKDPAVAAALAAGAKLLPTTPSKVYDSGNLADVAAVR